MEYGPAIWKGRRGGPASNAVLLGMFLLHYLQRTFVFPLLIRGGVQGGGGGGHAQLIADNDGELCIVKKNHNSTLQKNLNILI